MATKDFPMHPGDESIERSRGKTAVWILLIGCLLFMVYAVAAGYWLEPIYYKWGLNKFFNNATAAENLGFTVWAQALPIAMILGVVGAAVKGRVEKGRIWAFAIGGILLVIIPLGAGGMIGEVISPIFGAGGILIELFLLLTLWFWAKRRATLKGTLRTAADLRMAGYMALAFATWYTCGTFAQPIYGLRPEKMLEFETLPMAISMAYAMSAFFVVGWALIFASQYVAAKET